MEKKVEQLQAVVVDAFRGHRDQVRRHETWMGLLPGEPVDNEKLDRDEDLPGPLTGERWGRYGS